MRKDLLSDMLSEIKTGDLIAFNRRRYNSMVSFVLWSYHKVMKAEFSHVGIAMWAGDSLFIVEAISPRVAITPIETVEDFYWFPVELTPPEHILVKFLKSYVGKPYSLLDMFTHYFGVDFNPDYLYCSELASSFYYDVGLIMDRDHGHTPDSLVNAVRSRMEMETGVYPEGIHIAVDRGNL